MFGGDDDFDFIPDMDGDGDHDLMDFMILDTILSEDEKLEEDEDDDILSSLDSSDDDWRDEHDEGYEFDVDPNDYDTEDEFLEALEEAKYGWRETYEDDTDYDVDPEDYETEDEYLEALEEAKTAWHDDCEDGSEYGLDPEDYDSQEEYEAALREAKYGWRDTAEDGSDFGVFADEYETADEYEKALNDAKYAWRKTVEDGSNLGVYPEDYETEEEYLDALSEAQDEDSDEDEGDWRSKYENSRPNPMFYASEVEYLLAVEEQKYSWRKYCSNRFGISANDFETREEYNAAVNAAYDAERRRKIAEREADPTNFTVYKFCKVCTDYPNKPYYYYFTGDLLVKVGNHVIVPLGQTNRPAKGIVMSVGECYGCALPCKVEYMKYVSEIIDEDKDEPETLSVGPIKYKAYTDYICYDGLSKAKVGNIKIKLSKGHAEISFILEKTYDTHGVKGRTNIRTKWRLKNSDGLIVDTGGTWYETLQVGDKIQGVINLSELDDNESYLFEFVDN